MVLGPKFSLKISVPRTGFFGKFGPSKNILVLLAVLSVVEHHVHVLRALHLLKRFQYSYLQFSLSEYKGSYSTACLAVSSLGKGRDTSGWFLLFSPACLQVSRKSSLCTAGIKTGQRTAILAEHATSACTGQPKNRETSGWLGIR